MCLASNEFKGHMFSKCGLLEEQSRNLDMHKSTLDDKVHKRTFLFCEGGWIGLRHG